VQRPLQVTIAAGVTLLWAAYSLGYGALYATGILRIPKLEEMTPPNFDPETFRLLTGALTMLGAALWAPVGIGLLRLKRWARTLALVLYGISLPMGIFYAVSFGRSFGDWLLLAQVIFITTEAVVIWLLIQQPVRQAFGVGAAPPRPVAEIRQRPLAVKILVVLCLLAGVGSLLFGIVYAVAFPLLDTGMKMNPEMVRMMRIGMIAGVLPWAAGYALCAFGLWRLRNWARILLMVFAVLWLAPALIMLVALIPILLAAPSLPSLAIVVIMLLLMSAIPTWILWYLFRARTKQLFTARLTSSAPGLPSSGAA